MQRVYEENEWGKVSKRIITAITDLLRENSPKMLEETSRSDSALIQHIQYSVNHSQGMENWWTHHITLGTQGSK